MPDLSVVIVSWNTRELLHACLTSLFKDAGDLKLEVFVADNASADRSVAMLRNDFPHVRLIENRENLGFAVANNRLIARCSADFILLLNPDTVIKPGALRALLDFARKHPDAGALGPKLLHPHARLDVLGCGGMTNLRRTFNHYFFLSRLFPRFRPFEGLHLYVNLDDKESRPVGWVSGACMLVRRETTKRVGPLSERWFMYAEDQEWCARMIAGGWKVYFVPDAVVEHHLGASAEQNPDVSLLPFQAGRDLFIMLNRPSRIQLFVFDAVRALGCGIRAVAYWIKSLGAGNNKEMWRQKARVFWAYARSGTGARPQEINQATL